MLAAAPLIQVQAEAASLPELAEALPDLHELDVIVAAADALPAEEVNALLQEMEPPPGLLLLSEQPEAAQSLPALSLRAWGLLSPDCSETELSAAVLAVHEGLLAAAPALLAPLLGPPPIPVEELREELTERELDVLQLLAEGLANKQIALRLGISENTVKFHSSAIYAKLGVTNRTEAVRRGARLGLVVL